MYKKIALVVLSCISYPVFSASFDCNLAKQDAEKLVCSNIELSKLDDELSKLYSDVKVKAQDKNQLMSSQLDWLKYDRNNCNNLACVFNAYESRMDILNAWILNQGVPNSSGMYWGYVTASN